MRYMTMRPLSLTWIVGSLLVGSGCNEGTRSAESKPPAAATQPAAPAAAPARSGTIEAKPNPIQVCEKDGLGQTTLTWTGNGVEKMAVHVGTPDGPLFAETGGTGGSKATEKWVKDGMVFYLQEVDGQPPSAANTLATTRVTLTTEGCP